MGIIIALCLCTCCKDNKRSSFNVEEGVPRTEAEGVTVTGMTVVGGEALPEERVKELPPPAYDEIFPRD